MLSQYKWWLGFWSGTITGAWYWILTKLRLQSLVDPGLLALPTVTWSCQGFLSELVPTLTSLGWRLTASTPSQTMCVVLIPDLSENWYFEVCETYMWTILCNFVATLHLFCQSLKTVLWCGGQLLNVTFSFLRARCIRWPGFFSIRVSFRWVIDVVWLGLVCCIRLIRTLITVCSASFHLLRLSSTIQAAAAAHPLEFEVSRCRASQFARSFLPAQVRLWNDLPYTVFNTGTLDGFKGSVNS